MRRPVQGKAIVESRRLVNDRPLIIIGPDHEIWNDGLLPLQEMAYGIAWVKPPPHVDPTVVAALLRAKGVYVKLLPPDRVDAVVTEARPEAAPELGLQDARETVYELCRKIAARSDVDPEDAIREAEMYLSAVGL